MTSTTVDICIQSWLYGQILIKSGLVELFENPLKYMTVHRQHWACPQAALGCFEAYVHSPCRSTEVWECWQKAAFQNILVFSLTLLITHYLCVFKWAAVYPTRELLSAYSKNWDVLLCAYFGFFALEESFSCLSLFFSSFCLFKLAIFMGQ